MNAILQYFLGASWLSLGGKEKRDQQQGGARGSGQHCSAVISVVILVVCGCEQAALDCTPTLKGRLGHLAGMIANGWRDVQVLIVFGMAQSRVGG